VAGHRARSLPRSGGGDELHDPGATLPMSYDELVWLVSPELLAGVTPVLFLEFRCGERD
jgi:hypothetical protein